MREISEKRVKRLMTEISLFIIHEYEPICDDEVLSLSEILFQLIESNQSYNSKQWIHDVCLILTNMRKFAHLLDDRIEYVKHEGFHGSLRYKGGRP